MASNDSALLATAIADLVLEYKGFYVCVVEAKKENFISGRTQNLIENELAIEVLMPFFSPMGLLTFVVLHSECADAVRYLRHCHKF